MSSVFQMFSFQIFGHLAKLIARTCDNSTSDLWYVPNHWFDSWLPPLHCWFPVLFFFIPLNAAFISDCIFFMLLKYPMSSLSILITSVLNSASDRLLISTLFSFFFLEFCCDFCCGCARRRAVFTSASVSTASHAQSFWMWRPHSTHPHSLASIPPLTSTAKSSLFMHTHSSPLSLTARLHWCHTMY